MQSRTWATATVWQTRNPAFTVTFTPSGKGAAPGTLKVDASTTVLSLALSGTGK
jgi:hypothetical protein